MMFRLLSAAGLLLSSVAMPAVAATDTSSTPSPTQPMAVSCTVLLPPAPVPGLPGTLRMVEKLTVPPGSDAHRHKHDIDEMMEVVSGSGRLSIDGKPDVELKPGVVVEIQPGTLHQQHNGSETEPLVYTATFIGKAGAHMLTRYTGEKDRTAGCPHTLPKK
ncbi:cupin domain-containing protein [Azospirillum sp. CT11-132]|uniref:cupin domain-containing protein n=1 Tax=unclassified Azospirillum TaxID=2630922 RepID=UPI000D60DBF0|nr:MULTISPECIES: cupin domain-containing protein [unclassified Azospirillum]PWC60625.1 hypothetical protein TSH7_18460 [Azospirillum sp. TSH7]PWC72076.1 hypothetical protein TSH20_02175 [Azospirillum sp. TSH20]